MNIEAGIIEMLFVVLQKAKICTHGDMVFEE